MRTTSWIAISVYLLVAIVRKRLGIELTLYTILQILTEECKNYPCSLSRHSALSCTSSPLRDFQPFGLTHILSYVSDCGLELVATDNWRQILRGIKRAALAKKTEGGRDKTTANPVGSKYSAEVQSVIPPGVAPVW